jgi:hypothetical protein
MLKVPKGLQEPSNFSNHVSVFDHCGHRNAHDHARKRLEGRIGSAAGIGEPKVSL